MTKARSNATAKAAKGDLTVGSGTNLSDVLAVGNNGETIVADSSTSTGLRYQAPVNSNPTLNSAFQVWQRGTSFSITNTNTYTADRWNGQSAGPASTFSRQVTNDTTNLPFIQYCMRVQRNSGQTSTSPLILQQSFETINTIPYVGKTVTVSFYARKGADYSATSSLLNAVLYSGTGTDQGIQGTYTGIAVVAQTNAALTTTWQRFSFNATLGTTVNEMALYFRTDPTGTASTNDYFEITGVQIEVGSVATPFKTYAGTIQGELAACQRYYQRFTGTGSNPGASGYGYSQNTGNVVMGIPPVTTMRVTPTAIDYTGLQVQDNLNNLVTGFSSITMETTVAGPSCFSVNFTKSAAYTAGRTYRLIGASANDYIGFSAEL